jgi:hypothetical protein
MWETFAMNDQRAFAPEYSLKEKLRIIAVSLLVGSIFIFAMKLVFFPWLTAFASTNPCNKVLGLSAAQVLWYGMFVGMPMMFALLIGGFGAYQGARVLRDGQSPPVGQKVMRPTRIRVGTAAKVMGWFQVLSFVPFVLVGFWGTGPAAELSEKALMTKDCAAPR